MFEAHHPQLPHPPPPDNTPHHNTDQNNDNDTPTKHKGEKEKNGHQNEEVKDAKPEGSARGKKHFAHLRGHKKSQSHGSNANEEKDLIKRINSDERADELRGNDNDEKKDSPSVTRKGSSKLSKKKEKITAHSLDYAKVKRNIKDKEKSAKKRVIEMTHCYKFEKMWDDSKTGAVPFEISIYRFVH